MGRSYPTRLVLRGILFDWGNTLVRWEFDSGLLAEGHAQGLAAVGGAAARAGEVFARSYRELVLPRLFAPREDEVDYTALVGEALAASGLDAGAGDADRFVAAEHAVWRLAHRIEPRVLELLDELGARGLRLGLVSNLFDPPALMRVTFAELGVLDRLDAIAISAEVGKRKPHRAIFEHALDLLGVGPSEAGHVGDRLHEDVGGAAAIGLRTIQATWYADDDATGLSPDARAVAPADVLRIVERWLGQR